MVSAVTFSDGKKNHGLYPFLRSFISHTYKFLLRFYAPSCFVEHSTWRPSGRGSNCLSGRAVFKNKELQEMYREFAMFTVKTVT